MIFKDDKNKLEDYKEYNKVIEALLKTSGNDKILQSFDTKLIRKPHPDLPQQILALTTIAEGINDKELKNMIYHKIIEELVLQIFGIYDRSKDN